ncbi:MAG: hypothetical protein RJB66_1198 [Pseudomonadota bacterium]|jgi:hypothetical protein
MRFFELSHFLFCLSIIFCLGACSQDSSSGGSGAGNGAPIKKPQWPADCDQAWATIVKTQPKGRMTAYENKSFIKTNTAKDLTSHINIKTTVTESNSNEVVTIVETEMLAPVATEATRHEEKLTKSDFLQFCRLGDDRPTNPMEEPQERFIGIESITVRAGRFQATHRETILNQSQNGLNMRTKTDFWVSNEYEGLTIRSISESSSEMEGDTYTTVFETELIEFRK